mmetsp:Transcript_11889/g.24493  ORF Transcript_11889/g.24493 Transcript_11889/m.24493 type:complete len:98 (-) Transcript_11889:124-417(-)
MEAQLAAIHEMQKRQREPRVEESTGASLEGQAVKVLSEVLVPAVTKSSSKLILAPTRVLEGFKATMRAQQVGATGGMCSIRRDVCFRWLGYTSRSSF